MTKKNISRILLAIMIVTNIYLIWRVNSNNTMISSYDAGISQKTGVGKLESYWSKYIGSSKNASVTYEDKENAESDSNKSIAVLFILDIVFVGALFRLNKSPKPEPVQNDDDWRTSRKSRRR